MAMFKNPCTEKSGVACSRQPEEMTWRGTGVS